jgi:hypothetical protein
MNEFAREFEARALANPDSENRYVSGTNMAFCGEKESAVRLLKAAIEGHSCAYTALQKDPLLASLRSSPEYGQLLSAAKQCQDSFVTERAQLSH